MDNPFYDTCKISMEARGIPVWVLEAYEVERAIRLAYRVCADDIGIFNVLIGRIFDGIYGLGSTESTEEKYLDRLIFQVNHKRALEELKRRANNGDKEAAEMVKTQVKGEQL